MAKMGAAAAANDLLADHAMTCVSYRAHRLAGKRQPEARPARSGIVLMARSEQLRVAADAAVDAIVLVIDILAREWPFRAFVLGNVVLLVGQPFLEVGIRGIRVIHSISRRNAASRD